MRLPVALGAWGLLGSQFGLITESWGSLILGLFMVFARERIVARHRRRARGRARAQPAMPWLVFGSLLVFNGLLQLSIGLRTL